MNGQDSPVEWSINSGLMCTEPGAKDYFFGDPVIEYIGQSELFPRSLNPPNDVVHANISPAFSEPVVRSRPRAFRTKMGHLDTRMPRSARSTEPNTVQIEMSTSPP
jgi:hypothetical protein